MAKDLTMARFNVIFGLLYGSRLKVGGGLASPRYYVLDKDTGKAVARFVDAVSAKRRAEYRNGKETPQRSSCKDSRPSADRPVGVGDVVAFAGRDWTVVRGPYPLACGLAGYDLAGDNGGTVRGIAATSIQRKY